VDNLEVRHRVIERLLESFSKERDALRQWKPDFSTPNKSS
jgi:hypothetical protein